MLGLSCYDGKTTQLGNWIIGLVPISLFFQPLYLSIDRDAPVTRGVYREELMQVTHDISEYQSSLVKALRVKG